MSNKKPTYRPQPTQAIDFDALMANLDAQAAAIPKPAEPRGMARAVADTALSFGRGAVQGVRMLSDVAGADNRVSGALRTAEDFIGGLQSAQAKQDQQEVSRILKEAENQGVLDQVVAGAKAFAVAPGQLMAQAAGTSIPTLATAMIPGAGPMAVAARLGAGAAMGGAQGVGAVKSTIYDEVQQDAIARGLPKEEAARLAAEAQAYSGQNAGQIALGGGLGVLAGSTGAERMLGGLRNGVTKQAPGVMRRVATGAATEAVPEAVQGGQEKYAANVAVNNAGGQREPWAGVAANAAMEGLAGAAMGGAFGLPRPAEQAQAGTQPPAPPPTGDDLRREKLPETGPMARALNSAVEAAAQKVDAAQQASPTPAASQNGAAHGPAQYAPHNQATTLNDMPFSDRVLTVREQLADKATRQALRDRLGNEALNEATYYAELADRADVRIPDSTRDRFLSVAERMVSEVMFTRTGAAPIQLAGNSERTHPQIGLDTTSTGVLRADAAGNVAPETRAQAIEALQRQREAAEENRRLADIGLTPDVLSVQKRNAKAMGGAFGLPRPAEEAPVERAPRTSRADPVLIDAQAPNTVAQYVARMEATNTPAGRAFVQDYRAGRITDSDVLALAIPNRPSDDPNTRLAQAAAQAPQDQIQPGDLLTASGQPFRNIKAAQTAAKRQNGAVIAVDGGWTVRKTEGTTDAPNTGGTAGQRASDTGRSDGAGVLRDERPADVLVSTGSPVDQGNAGPGPAGPGTGARPETPAQVPALSIGQTVKLSGKTWQVEAQDDASVTLNAQDGTRRTVSKTSKSFGQLVTLTTPTPSKGGADEEVTKPIGAETATGQLVAGQQSTKGQDAAAPEAKPKAGAAGAAQAEPAAEAGAAVVPGAGSAAVEADGVAPGPTETPAVVNESLTTEAQADASPGHAARWDAMSAEERQSVAAKAGWRTAKGGANPQGRAIAKKPWAEQIPGTAKRLGDALGEVPTSAQNLNTSPESVQNSAQSEQVATKRTEARGKAKHPKTVAGSTVLAMVSQNLGGLDPEWLAEFSVRQEINRTGKDGRRMVQWRNPLIPGVGRLFRRGGTQDLQLLAELMESAGYLEPGSLAADGYEAGERAKAMVREALQGDEPLTWQGQIAKAQEEVAQAAQEEPSWFSEFDDSELESAGYTGASPEVQQATAALLAEAEALGLDTESMVEDAAREAGDQPGNAYDEIVQRIAREAVAVARGKAVGTDAAAEGRGAEDRGQPAGEAGQEPAAQEGLKRQDRREAKAEASQGAAAGAAPMSLLESTRAALREVYDGKASVETYQAAYRRVRDDEAGVKADLNKLTKDQLIRQFGMMARPSESKESLVKSAHAAILGNFALGKNYGPNSYMMTAGGLANYERQRLEALDALVAGQTADNLAAYAAEVAKDREEYRTKLDAAKKAVEDPKTLDDFRRFMQYHTRDGKTTTEVRRTMLTPEQRAEFDRLLSDESRGRRKATAEVDKARVSVAGQKVDGEIIATKHTKKGTDLFVVRLAERVSREDYETLNTGAKRIGGFYSSYRGAGAVPGFQFTTREQAEAFRTLANGDNTAAVDAAKERRDSFEDDRSQSAVERLNEMADRLEERADESLGRDRKANTQRRARFAAAAEAGANADKALAGTMRNIAAAIQSGTASMLDRVRQKVQVEYLRAVVQSANDSLLRERAGSYAEFERQRGTPPTAETADFATFPEYTAMRSDLASLGRQLLEVDGTKKLGERLMKVADDVSDAFTAWVKEPGNFHRVAGFRNKETGETAGFKSKDVAERAIERSGYRGKAMAWSIKRGEWTIVLTPSEAMARGIWQGDGDKRITLSDDFGAELVEKIGRANRRGAKVSVPWVFENTYDRRKLLARMGIETPAEFRAALREFIALQERPEAPSRVKALERALVGRRNDGLDFFPTPEGTADEMVAAAGIEPGMRVLEPSGGMGHIADRIRAAGHEPEVVEIESDKRELLEAKGFNVVGQDFLAFNDANHAERGATFGDLMRAPDGTTGILRGQGGMGSDRVRLVSDDVQELERGKFNFSELELVERRGVGSGYDRIVMNPPFSNGRDIEHVRHAFSLLKPGGRLVAIMGESAFNNQNTRASEFRDWLDELGGTSEKLADGTFLDPSLPVNTSANARMVVIDKPDAEPPTFSRHEPKHKPRGVSMTDARAVAANVRRAFPGAPAIYLHESINKAPEDLKRSIKKAGAWGDVEAAFHNGEIHVFIERFSSIERMEFVVGRHEIRHFGLAGLLGNDRHALMLRLYNGNDRLAIEADMMVDAGVAPNRAIAVEEMLADMPVPELEALTGWRQFIADLKLLMRQVSAKVRKFSAGIANALEPSRWSDDEIIALVKRAEGFARKAGPSGAAQRGTVFSTSDDGPLSEAKFYSRYLMHKDIRGKRSGNAAQTAAAIMRDGFQPQGPGAVNVMPAYRGGEPLYLSDQTYGPRAGDTVYLVPRESVKNNKVVAGWKPKPFEVLTITEDYPALYPLYVEAFNAAQGDPDSPNIMFSRLDAAAIYEAVPPAAMQWIEDRTTSQRGFNRWWHRTVGTQFHKAKTNKEFGVVYNAVQDFMKDVSRIATLAADKAPDMLPQVETLGDLGKLAPTLVSPKAYKQRKADIEAASSALFDGTLRYTRDEDGRPVRVEADSEELGGIVWTAQELRERGLSERAIGMYEQSRAAVDQSLDNMLAADLYRHVSVMDPQLIAGTPAELDALLERLRTIAASDNPSEAAQVVRDAMRERLDKVQTALDGQPNQHTPDLMQRRQDIRAAQSVVADKVNRIAELKASGYMPLMRFGPYAVDAVDGDGQRVHFGLYESQAEANKAARRFRESGLRVRQSVMPQKQFESLKGVSPETAMLFAEMLGVEKNEAMQTWLKNAVAEQSALKRHIRRKGIEGFNEDGSRVLAAFLTSNARAASRALHSNRISEAVENIEQGDVQDEARALAEYVNNPKEEAQAIRSLLFVQYIGGSIASALVNLTQTFGQTFPFLSQYGGARKAGARVTAAMKLALSKSVDDQELAAAIQRAERDGILKPQEIFQLQAEASRSLGSNLYARSILTAWGSMFQLAEQYNRRVAFIAAFKTAKEEGRADAFAFAENAVDETQSVFNKGNRPNWARGPVGATLLTFKTFSIQYLEFLKRLATAGDPGSQERKQGQKAAALALAALVVMAGTSGLPGVDDLEDVIDTIAQGLGYNWTTAAQRDRFLDSLFGEVASEIIQHGVSGIPGVPFDISTRMGMGNLLPATGVMKKSEDRKQDQVLEILGVGGSTLRDATKGEFLPVAIRNISKALDAYNTGMYRDSRGRNVTDVTPFEAALKAIGLQPSAVARTQRKVGADIEQRNLYQAVREEITSAWAEARFMDDKAGIDKARAALARWNESNPDARIVIQPQTIARRVANMRRNKIERTIANAPRPIRAQTAEALQ